MSSPRAISLIRPSNVTWRARITYGHDGPVYLSRGQSIGQRLVPMTRDLTFLWEEGAHETLDENKQKVRDASRRAILEWARSSGEGTDYTDNVPIQRFKPAGPLLRGAEPAPQRRARPPPRRTAGPPLADGSQHRHPGRERRSGRPRPGHRGACHAWLRSDRAAGRRQGRRARAGGRQAPVAGRAGSAARRHRIPAPLLQYIDHLDRPSRPCSRRSS